MASRGPTHNQRLVPPGIVRKLDPSLGGIEESLRELEGILLPRFQVGFPPQRLTMTLLGEYWAGRAEVIPSAALVRLLGDFGISESAARMALGRLAARGVLIRERRGRTTGYRQSPGLLAILSQGRAVTARFGEPRRGWDGNWSVVTWQLRTSSTEVSHRIRTNLREHGFAPLNTGVWVSPDPLPDDPARLFGSGSDVHFSAFTARDGGMPGAQPAVSAWDLDEVRSHYDEFVPLFGPALAATLRATPEQALVTRTRAVYKWFVIATLDPDLPAELLPDGWPRSAARRIFVELVDRCIAGADERVRTIIGEVAPELVPLVTLPASYGVI